MHGCKCTNGWMDERANLWIRPFLILMIVRPRIFESKFRDHCAKKLDGALRKPTSFVERANGYQMNGRFMDTMGLWIQFMDSWVPDDQMNCGFMDATGLWIQFMDLWVPDEWVPDE